MTGEDFTSLMTRMAAPNSARQTSTHDIHSETAKLTTPRPISGIMRSSTTGSRNNNRLTLSFPVQALDSSAISVSGSESGAVTPALEAPLSSSPSNQTDFMVVLAAQERRVFELREELQRAEYELKKLKRQWAQHEANKKRAELRQTERPQAIQNRPVLDPDVEEGPEDAAVWKSVEHDRKKAILLNASRKSERTVISGGHTRALSLLSPERGSFNGIQTNSANGRDPMVGLARSTTAPQDGPDNTIKAIARAQHLYQENVPVQVKQIAEDLRAGLWTFVEDLRQATIGDAALQDPAIVLTKKPSRGNLSRRGSKQVDMKQVGSKVRVNRPKNAPDAIPIKKSLESVHDPDSQTPRSARKTDSGVAAIDDDWGNWSDSPFTVDDHLIDLGAEDETITISSRELPGSASKRMKMQLDPHSEISWPDLNSLSPENLKRTASAFIKDFERSLSPSRDEADPACSSLGRLHEEHEVRMSLSNLP